MLINTEGFSYYFLSSPYRLSSYNNYCIFLNYGVIIHTFFLLLIDHTCEVKLQIFLAQHNISVCSLINRVFDCEVSRGYVCVKKTLILLNGAITTA